MIPCDAPNYRLQGIRDRILQQGSSLLRIFVHVGYTTWCAFIILTPLRARATFSSHFAILVRLTGCLAWQLISRISSTIDVWFNAIRLYVVCGTRQYTCYHIQCGAVKTRSIFSQTLTIDTHSSPVSVVNLLSDSLSATAIAVSYVISW